MFYVRAKNDVGVGEREEIKAVTASISQCTTLLHQLLLTYSFAGTLASCIRVQVQSINSGFMHASWKVPESPGLFS